ncbi:MAG: hypothetical protein MK200_05110 [Nitrosopumilus sp.]|nr:hypothetical protein [Nitrosopumilus sp.]
MESIIEINDLASDELPSGSAHTLKPLCSVLGDNGSTTKVYTSCPSNNEENCEKMCQQEEFNRLYDELFNDSNEFEDFAGFPSEEESDVEEVPQEQENDFNRLYHEQIFNDNNELDDVVGFPIEEESIVEEVVQQKKKKWDPNDILCLMKCYYQSKPDVRGYRKRMFSLWIKNGRFEATEQQLCDQVRNILKKGRLSLLQLEEAKRGLVETTGEKELPNMEIYNRNQIATGDDNEHVNGGSDGIVNIDADNVSDVEKGIMDELQKIIEMVEMPKSINLRKIDRGRVREKTQVVNKVIHKYHTNSITGTNKLIRAGAIVVCNLLGVKNVDTKEKQEPFWKRRIEQKIMELRKDISLIERREVEGYKITETQGKNGAHVSYESEGKKKSERRIETESHCKGSTDKEIYRSNKAI